MILVFSLITTAVFSAIHGHGFLTKWLNPLAQFSILFLACLPFYGWQISLASLPATLYFWLTMRTSRQAKPELKAQDPINNPDFDRAQTIKPYIIPVAIACVIGLPSFLWHLHYWHLLVCLVAGLSVLSPYLSTSICNYQTSLGKRVGWNHGRFWDVRRFNEFSIGLTTGGLSVYIILKSLLLWGGVWMS